jgi:hypothetical protein
MAGAARRLGELARKVLTPAGVDRLSRAAGSRLTRATAGGAAGFAAGGPLGLLLGGSAGAAGFRTSASILAGGTKAVGFYGGAMMASVGLGIGLGAIGMAGGLVTAPYEGYMAAKDAKSRADAAYLRRLIQTQQIGPFGTGDRPYGMHSNFNNSAGMALALHYGRSGTGIPHPLYSLASSYGQGVGGMSARYVLGG